MYVKRGGGVELVKHKLSRKVVVRGSKTILVVARGISAKYYVFT